MALHCHVSGKEVEVADAAAASEKEEEVGDEEGGRGGWGRGESGHGVAPQRTQFPPTSSRIEEKVSSGTSYTS